MHILILGEDGETKQEKILDLKGKLLPSPDAKILDYEVLYGTKLDAATLQKTLKSLPAVAAARCLLLHDCHKLDPTCQQAILEFVGLPSPKVVLLMESNTWAPDSVFVKKIKPHVKIIDLLQKEKGDVFEVTRAMGRKQVAEALKGLEELFSQGVHPLQIMGALVWFWGKQRTQLDKEQFEEGLIFLQEADLHIKRSRMPSEYAVELLVVKLCGML